jgi:hypothetical protein
MNTIRMLAFIAAVLITAVLFRVIADGLTDEQADHVATEAGATDRPQAAVKDPLRHPAVRRASASP